MSVYAIPFHVMQKTKLSQFRPCCRHLGAVTKNTYNAGFEIDEKVKLPLPMRISVFPVASEARETGLKAPDGIMRKMPTATQIDSYSRRSEMSQQSCHGFRAQRSPERNIPV